MYFDSKGPQNTDQTLKLACERARELGIDTMVVATTTGRTAYRALELCEGMKLVAVSYHAGFRKPFKLSIEPETVQDLNEKGVPVVCATHSLSGVERGLSRKHPGVYPVLLIADVLRMFGQGTKVAIEVAIMAADAGHLTGKRIVACGGSSKGCDTALVLTPANMNEFFEMRIHEIVCKPSFYAD
jgi:hypothetical protein